MSFRCALVVLTLAACSPMPSTTGGSVTAFTVDDDPIRPGQSTTLHWASTGAEACTLIPGNTKLPASGSTTVSPTTDTTYRVTCAGGSKTLTVHVRDGGSIDSFTADQTEVLPETAVTLTWASTHTTSCSLAPGDTAVETSGHLVVRPLATTTYTLRCTSEQDVATATVAVTVTPVSTIDPPVATVTPGDGFITVTWSQPMGATNVYLASAPGIVPATVGQLPDGLALRQATSPLFIGGLLNGTAYYVVLTASAGSVVSVPSAEQRVVPVAAAPMGDPLFADQWHLASTGTPANVNVTDVWAMGLKGEGVKIAVTDEGVDLGHEDLKANVAVGKSKDYLGNAAVALAEHGTCVAGLIAARDENGLGVRGVAPHAQVRSYNFLQDSTSNNLLDAMRRDKDEIWINSNSWGHGMNTGVLIPNDPLFTRGVSEGATTGRGGKGVVYLFAAGNGADPTLGNTDNSNFSFTTNSRFTLAIGGVGYDDRRPSYAVPGATVLVVGPTEGDDHRAITTTDLTGEDGYNWSKVTSDYGDRSYTKFFNGTSASTPIVAGVVALLLQARPELSYRDVRRVLALSARKPSPGSSGWDTNAAGLKVNHDFGFGVADAKAGVALAKTIELVGPEVKYDGAWTTVGQPIPDQGDAVRSSITVSNSGIGHIEFVEIEVDVAHGSSGDLEVVLERQGSVSDLLHPTHNCSTQCQPIDHYVFGSVRHLEEAADGTWTLTVRDRRTLQVGTFNGWTLRIYGRQ